MIAQFSVHFNLLLIYIQVLLPPQIALNHAISPRIAVSEGHTPPAVPLPPIAAAAAPLLQ